MNKCHIIACFVCHDLSEVERADAVCCSTRCRMYLKRHPELRSTCDSLKLDVRFYVKVAAFLKLFPERADSIHQGELDLSHPVRRDSIREDLAGEMCRAFTALVIEAARAS